VQLECSNGKTHDRVFISPFVNLARILFNQKGFDAAHRVLKLAWSFVSPFHHIRDQYAEFGWMMVNEERFAAACEHMNKCLRAKEADTISMLVSVYAAWRAGSFGEHAEYLGDRLLESSERNPWMGACASLLSKWSSADNRAVRQDILHFPARVLAILSCGAVIPEFHPTQLGHIKSLDQYS